MPYVSNISFAGLPYISRSFKGTRHIRDMYEIYTEQRRDISKSGTKITRPGCEKEGQKSGFGVIPE